MNTIHETRAAMRRAAKRLGVRPLFRALEATGHTTYGSAARFYAARSGDVKVGTLEAIQRALADIDEETEPTGDRAA